MFWFVSYPWTTILCKHPLRFWLMNLHRLTPRFLIPLTVLFARTLSLMCHAALSRLSSVTFGVLDSILSYDWSQRVMKFVEVDHLKIWEGRNAVSISSRRRHPAVCIRTDRVHPFSFTVSFLEINSHAMGSTPTNLGDGYIGIDSVKDWLMDWSMMIHIMREMVFD
jgi:hypothetical protein